MAVTNRYDTYKKYKDGGLDAVLEIANRDYAEITEPKEQLANQAIWNYNRQITSARNTVDEFYKQKQDYFKAFGSTMLAGSNVGMDSASVSTNAVPLERTDPILDTTASPKKKKRADNAASALGL